MELARVRMNHQAPVAEYISILVIATDSALRPQRVLIIGELVLRLSVHIRLVLEVIIIFNLCLRQELLWPPTSLIAHQHRANQAPGWLWTLEGCLLARVDATAFLGLIIILNVIFLLSLWLLLGVSSHLLISASSSFRLRANWCRISA